MSFNSVIRSSPHLLSSRYIVFADVYHTEYFSVPCVIHHIYCIKDCGLVTRNSSYIVPKRSPWGPYNSRYKLSNFVKRTRVFYVKQTRNSLLNWITHCLHHMRYTLLAIAFWALHICTSPVNFVIYKCTCKWHSCVVQESLVCHVESQKAIANNIYRTRIWCK